MRRFLTLALAKCLVWGLLVVVVGPPRQALAEAASAKDAPQAQETDSAASDAGDEAVGRSGLPLPRFASLRSNEANLRTGPGTRYPIDWVFVAKGIPVEITAEYDVWRRVRDWEGSEGWVHKASLSGKRSVIVTGTMRELRQKADPKASIVAHLEPGALGDLLSCAPDWCRVRFGDSKGYLRKTEFWGAYAPETFE